MNLNNKLLSVKAFLGLFLLNLKSFVNSYTTESIDTDDRYNSRTCFENVVQEREISQALDQSINRIWQKHHDDEYEEPAELLKMFNCPMYSDEFGIQGGSSTQLPYSRIPTEDETWKLFEDAYYFALGIKSPEKKQSRGLGGMQVPVEFQYDRKIGRSVHVTSFIPKGTLVWTSSRTVAFTNTEELAPEESTTESYKKNSTGFDGTGLIFQSYRRFLEYLHDHQVRTNDTMHDGTYDWTCDALMWTYSTQDKISGDWGVCISFDYGSLFNYDYGDKNTANVFGHDCNTVKEGYPRDRITNDSNTTMTSNNSNTSDSSNYKCLCYSVWASRDIQPGEELRYDDDEGDD